MSLTDFNDLNRIAGEEAVRTCVEAAVEPAVLNTVETNSWPKPTPLPCSLPAVQPFDPDLLPVAFRAFVEDVAHRMQCPPDYVAVGLLVAASSVVGARVVIQPKAQDDWTVVPNLWGLIIGRPGVMKSPALSEALHPLNRLQSDEQQIWKSAHEGWRLDFKLAELQAAENEKKAKSLSVKDPASARILLHPIDLPPEPAPRRFIVNDPTVEALGELLKVNPWGTMVYRDELYGLLSSMDRQGQEGGRAFYLQGHDGNQSYVVDRIGRGEVLIPRVCLALLGGIQPGRLQEYVRSAVKGGSGDDGLLQRFSLAVWPDIRTEFCDIDQPPDVDAKRKIMDVFSRLAAIEPANDTEPTICHFDPAAQELFSEWRIPFEIELRGGELHPAMESHLAKYRKLIPSLALLFALIDTPDAGSIGKKELLRALAWSEYLRSHANRLYAAAVIPEAAGAELLLKHIRNGKLERQFTPRLVIQKGWTGLNTPDTVRKAADVLIEYDWLRREIQLSQDPGGRGRPSERYLINPAAFAKG
ncbi:Protein of unknown function [Noviherbaspirillum humi]|uniref:DUF3987 domain-containing protein n=1 Tax=Noviherbaspirillum humi TaxID=1688639 RepID=A0A239JAQ1_9BURK|nr:YfjI family protein [Noviherbaspirillum humi]SNT03096.1 Protein of unknown function [Noviherbaspirillum humi]